MRFRLFGCLYLRFRSFFFVFFFKHEMAYEMRISGWSSDVCSSDLLDDRGAPLPRRQRGKAAAEFPDGGPKRRNDGGSTQCHDVNSCRINGLRVYGLGRWLWMARSS